MKTFTPDEVPNIQPEACWRNSTWMGLAIVFLIMAGITAFTALPKHGKIEWALVFMTGIITLFFGILALNSLIHSLRKDNWLIKVTVEGIYFNIRNAQNRHLPAPYPTVLYFQHNEIAGLGITHEYLRFPGQRGKKLDQNQYIDFYLTQENPTAIASILHKERRLGLKSTLLKKRKVDRYPVQLAQAPPALRIHWDWIRPKAKQSLETFEQWFPVSHESRELRILWKKLDDAEKLALINHLWETGQVRDAAKILHLTQRMSPRQCKAWFQENLIDQAKENTPD